MTLYQFSKMIGLPLETVKNNVKVLEKMLGVKVLEN